MLGLWPLLLLIAFLFSLGEAKLEGREQNTFFKLPFTAAGDYTGRQSRLVLFWRIGLVLYLFGRVGRLGEDGLPVRPHKHDE